MLTARGLSLQITILLALLGGCGPAVPSPVAQLQAEAEPGQVVVVDFVDFECRYCRQQHLHLTKAIAQYGNSVRVVYKYVALPSHPSSLALAAMAICAEKEGKGPEMTDAQMRNDSSLVVRTKGVPLAEKLGLDRRAFHRCIGDPQTAQRIITDYALYRELGGSGVPWVWIGKRNFVGVHPPAVLRQAIEQARATSN